MEKFTISLDATRNEQKPTDDVRRIGFRLKRAEVTLEELATKLTQPYGYTFSPGVFNADGVRSNKAWVNQQLFALDFDHGITLDEVLARATMYDVMPAFAYTSFSSTEFNHKFRVIWALDELVTTEQVRNLVILSLMQIFPESDNSCKDASRIYFGGKEIIHNDYEKRISVVNLVDTVIQVTYLHDKVHASSRLKKWSQQVGLNLVNGMPSLTQEDEVVKSGELSTTTKHILVNEVNSPFFDTSPTPIQFAKVTSVNDFKIKYEPITDVKQELELLRGTDFAQLAEECEVFRDFMNGVDHHHAVTWMVMCNLLLLEGGEKMFWTGLHNRDEFNVTKWQGQIYARRRQRRVPPGYRTLEPWYPGITERMQYKNLYLLAESQRGNVQMVSEPEYIPLEQAERLNTEYYREATMNKENKVWCIKAQTGLGKTKTALEFGYEHAIYAVPTHKLKDELVVRAMEAGHTNVQATPKTPEGHWTEEVKRLHAVGAVSKASAYLRNLAKEEPELQEYFEKLDKLQDTGLIFTTHARLPYLKTTAPLIIIDEDIYSTLVKQSSCRINDFKALILALTGPSKGFKTAFSTLVPEHDFSELLKLYEFIENAEYGTVFDLTNEVADLDLIREDLQKVIEKEVLNDRSITSNVLGLFWATHFIKNQEGHSIEYITRRELPEDKTIVIMSATLNKRMCELLFGDRLEWREVPMAKEASPVIMHTEYSYSRTSIKRREQEYKQLLQQYANDGFSIITFKTFLEKYENDKEMAEAATAIKATFGATAGLDFLKGENLAIIGTPYLLPYSYMLTAAALNVKLHAKPNAKKMEYKTIQRNNYTFRCMVFTIDPDLVEIQLAMIESELVQSVGRARSLRVSDVNLHLYSTFPIKGAQLA